MRILPKTWLDGVTVILVAIMLCVWAPWTGRRPSVASDLKHPSPGPDTGVISGPLRAPEGDRERLMRLVAALKAATEPEGRRNALAEMSRSLSGMPREVASAAVRELLDSGVDAPSQLGFGIGPDGFLTLSSSLRVFLLDRLAQIDRVAAAAYAEKIFSSLDSPDEWAVSLRNYALGSPTTQVRMFLQERFLEMIQHEPWQNNPSTGFLEAFDVAVYLGGTDLMPALTELIRRQDNRAVARSAYLALDRLTIANPADTFVYLLNNPPCMAGREQTRANYFARANVTDETQRKLLEDYLLAPARSTAEVQTFAGLFPNANFMVSHNLLTRTATPDGAARAQNDREALRVVEAWMQDERFSHLKSELENIRARLQSFVRPAGKEP